MKKTFLLLSFIIFMQHNAAFELVSKTPLLEHNGFVIDSKKSVYKSFENDHHQSTDKLNTISINDTIVSQKQNDLAPIKKAIFIAGQSNTLRGYGTSNAPSLTGKNLYQLGRGAVDFQVVPLTFYGTYSNTRDVNCASFGAIFLNYYYHKLKNDNPGRQVELLLVHCGAGGSGWAAAQYPNNSWRTDANYFNDLVNRIKWVKTNGYEIDAFLWHQGESDAVAQTVNYKDLLKNFIQSVRDYAEDQNLPFILGEMAHQWVAGNPNRAAYQDIINSINEEVPYTNVTSTLGLPLHTDGIHFTAQAHLELGRRYFNKFLTVKKNVSPVNYSVPTNGAHLVYNYNAAGGLAFPGIFEAIRFGTSPNEQRYSILGDLWKYKNNNGYYRFKLVVVSSDSSLNGKVIEWKQKINPFGLSENNTADRANCIILNNTIGIPTTTGQQFKSLAYNSPFTKTLFHADSRSSLDRWWFSIGQIAPFSNKIPILESNNSVTFVRLFCIKE